VPQIVRNIFEDYCKETFNQKDVVAVNNGTSALIAPLWSMDLQPDDEVITTPFTFIATSNSILISGGKPVFVDINEDDYLMDVDKIEDAITEKTKAIIPVHLYGRACNMDRIMEIADKHNLVVIEDTAQGFGAEYDYYDERGYKETKMLGTIGDVGTFSFYKTKNISTFEGGMITIPHHSKLDSDKIRSITDQGQVGRYNHEYIGFNFRLAEPLCLMALEQMKLHMKGVRAELGMRGPEQGHYPNVVYEQPIYKKLNISGNCPIAERVAKNIRESVNV
jgi:dTDP-4-amino-4,6-dideoxygalactose transaminase